MMNLRDIEKLQKLGKIRGFQKQELKPVVAEVGGRKVVKHWDKKSKEKDYISWNLLYWANLHCLSLEEEFRFHPERKWRFDWVVPAIMVAVEYNGIMSEKSRHTTVKGYTGDMNKINAAQAAGWKVIQLTPLNYKNLITELNKYL